MLGIGKWHHSWVQRIVKKCSLSHCNVTYEDLFMYIYGFFRFQKRSRPTQVLVHICVRSIGLYGINHKRFGGWAIYLCRRQTSRHSDQICSALKQLKIQRRETDRDGQTDKQREKQREGQAERDRDKERERENDRDRGTDRKRLRVFLRSVRDLVDIWFGAISDISPYPR